MWKRNRLGAKYLFQSVLVCCITEMSFIYFHLCQMRNKSDCSSTVWSACILGELTIKGHGKRMGYLNEPTPEIWKHSRWKTSRKHVVRGRPEWLRGAVTPLSIFTAAGLLCRQSRSQSHLWTFSPGDKAKVHHTL